MPGTCKEQEAKTVYTKMAEEKNQKQEMKQLVRLLDADIPGDKKILSSLRKITGVGFSMANALCKVLELDIYRKVGTLSDEEVQKIDGAVRHPEKYGIPSWLFNRRRASETGEDLHLLTSDLKLAVEFDIKKMKKIKTYKGVRHSMGQPVRGQKTRSHFRKGKGKGPGVVRSAAKPAEKKAEKK